MFPFGTSGWTYNYFVNGYNVKLVPFYRYFLFERKTEFNALHMGGKLFQQFVIDMWAKKIQRDMAYFRTQHFQNAYKKYFYSTAYTSHHDTVDENKMKDCSHIVLPSNYKDSPRLMLKHYFNAMAIVNYFRKPDLFVTMTCNPEWEEIVQCLKPGQTVRDRPDLVARVFRMKLQSFKDDLIKCGVLGKVVAHIDVIEYQLRGLPHAHLLLILSEEDRPYLAEHVDELISAEIPDKKSNPNLHEIVMKFMVHRNCKVYPNRPCINDDGKCRHDFPKKCRIKTEFEEDGFAEPKRRSPQDVSLFC